MAQLVDIIGPEAQQNFEQRILQRVKELDIPGDFTSMTAKPLLSFTLAELLLVAAGLDTTVNWLLTGRSCDLPKKNNRVGSDCNPNLTGRHSDSGITNRFNDQDDTTETDKEES